MVYKVGDACHLYCFSRVWIGVLSTCSRWASAYLSGCSLPRFNLPGRGAGRRTQDHGTAGERKISRRGTTRLAIGKRIPTLRKTTQKLGAQPFARDRQRAEPQEFATHNTHRKSTHKKEEQHQRDDRAQ